MLRTVLSVAIIGLLGGVALWYLLAMRALLRRLRDPQVAEMGDAERAAYIASPEYRRLRGAARLPVYATVLLFAALYVLMRSPL